MIKVEIYRFNGMFNQFIRTERVDSEAEAKSITDWNERLGMICYVFPSSI